MMYLTAAGLKKKTLAEIRKEQEADYVEGIGSDIGLSPDGPYGQIISISTKREADLLDLIQELYSARDKNQATDVQLDDVLNTVGLTRLPATAARVGDCVLWLPFGQAVTVPLGSTAKSATRSMVYSLESDVIQAATATGPFRAVRLELDALVTGHTLSVTLDSTSYTHIVQSTDTEADALGTLANTIKQGAFGQYGSASYEFLDNLHYLRIDAPSFVLNAHSTDFLSGASNSQSAQSGIFVAASAGAQPIPALTLDTINSPVAGWLSVEQPAAGVDGTDLESDTAFRLRAEKGIRSGSATDQAIQEALYRVAGVGKAFVTSNRTGVTDSEGRPLKSFEAVVIGGSDALVASAIYLHMPSGVLPYGTTSVNVLGSDGATHAIGFSRPVAKYAWVEVTNIVTDPDGGPTETYVQAIKDAISAYGRANFDLGDNFVLQRMYAPIYSVPGIYSVTLRIATTTTSGGSPTFGTSNILIASREYLSFDSAQVLVS